MAFKIFADMNINVCNKNISKVTNEFISISCAEFPMEPLEQRDMIMQKNHEKNQDMKTLESFIPILKEINKAQKFLPDYSSVCLSRVPYGLDHRSLHTNHHFLCFPPEL